ncbi:MAG: nucleotide exchange factor GrpE [Alistipes sp.]|nr:nucleotide exchange factor GrpE [Alistipes sp.]
MTSIFFSNNDAEQSANQALEALQQSVETMKIAHAEEIQKLYARIEELEAQVAQQKTNTEPEPTPEPQPEVKPEPAPEPAPAPAPETQPVPAVDYAPQFEALTTLVKELKAENAELKTLIGFRDRLEESVRDMHKEMEVYKNGFYEKITKPYLKALLELHTRFADVANHFENVDLSTCDVRETYDRLLGQFKNSVQAIADRVYNDFGIDYFEPEVGQLYDPRQHKAMRVVNTDDAEKHRVIIKVLAGGFKDVDSDKVISTARVETYTYVAPQEGAQSANEQ